MEKAFATATEFDRALKRAVRESGGDPGAGYRQALRDRFPCRVFRGGNRDFVLKGGSGMLARIPDARRRLRPARADELRRRCRRARQARLFRPRRLLPLRACQDGGARG